MVDVSAKEPTMRTAKATATVYLKPETLAAILEGGMSKGDVLGVARLAGIAAAKKTPELIPLSHPLAIHHAAVEFTTDPASGSVIDRGNRQGLRADRRGDGSDDLGRGGGPDHLRHVQGNATSRSVIGEIALLYKEGGKSGVYRREEHMKAAILTLSDKGARGERATRAARRWRDGWPTGT